jgi:pimeloyl-ACP methyl ester carboxylesterase
LNVSFKSARGIGIGERDAELDLGINAWPSPGMALPNWDPDPALGLFERTIEYDPKEKEIAMPLRERILRFPSAPIHGLHRLSQDQVNMGPVESFHTYRLLSHPSAEEEVTRIFLMHNGLNETRKMGLYYQIASHLIAQDPGTVCLVRPFPGHMTRSAYPGLTETPLDHYLWDGLHLFRQFLRYMIETRWLLSAIVRCSNYRCVSGSGLLEEKATVKGSRLETKCLVSAIMGEWENLYGASVAAIQDRRDGFPEMCDPPTEYAFAQAIDSLRDALELGRGFDGGSFDPKAEPELHVIGYSLGGFTAQSVFMSWPFLISSCFTLLSGGAMRELAPTAFADPEEWQTVLHSLRYELDDAMMDWRLQQAKGEWGAGMNPYLFLYLKRTFYEVFQQEYRGSFQTRLVSFRQRMLFVVGGNDPIVRPKSVLDAGPPDGINMLAIGGLGHFLADRPGGQVEEEQRDFWIPEIARTIGLLSKAAAKKHRVSIAKTWLDENELVPARSNKETTKKKREMRQGGRLTVAERLDIERGGSLSSTLFQRSLDDLLVRAATTNRGLLFILRNEPPTFLLGERALQQHASALYHEDVGIVEYIENVRTRRSLIRSEGARNRICVVLPWNVETVMRRIDAGWQHPSQSESSGEQMAGLRDAEGLWKALRKQCSQWTEKPYRDSVRVFHAPEGVSCADGVPEQTGTLTSVARDWLSLDDASQPIKPSLPDCWIWMSNEFLGRAPESPAPIQVSRSLLCEMVSKYVYRGKNHERLEKAERDIAMSLQKDQLRMVTVSRARYNPRFRGRIIAEPRQAQELLIQAALCIVASVPFKDFDFKSVSPPKEGVRVSPGA